MRHDVPDHIRRNRVLWDAWAQEYAAGGEDAWTQEHPTWGIWSVPESQIGMLPDDLMGKDVIELGCGTAWGDENSGAEGITCRAKRVDFCSGVGSKERRKPRGGMGRGEFL